MAHHRNSQTQTITFLVGGCYTPDAAVNTLWQNWEERETSIENAKAEKLKGETQLAMARISIQYVDEKLPIVQEELDEFNARKEFTVQDKRAMLELRKELAELLAAKAESTAKLQQAEAFAEQTLRSYVKAVEEREFIRNTMNDIIPYCKYKDEWLNNPDSASEKIQLEEWTYTMCDRAEKMLMTTGTISYDHLQSMMALPTYTQVIMPHIKRVRDLLLANNAGVSPLLDELLIPNNITHRMDNILPKMVTANFSPDDRLTMHNADTRWGALGLARIFLQSHDEKFEPNPTNLLPAMSRPDDKVLELPINMSRDEVKALDFLAARVQHELSDSLKLLGSAPEAQETDNG
jgi:hypothetical protein